MDVKSKQQWSMEEPCCLLALWGSTEVQGKLQGASGRSSSAGWLPRSTTGTSDRSTTNSQEGEAVLGQGETPITTFSTVS